MKIREVVTRRDKREFLQLPVRLYKGNPHWIRPLDKDVESVFDPESNKTFRQGECQRWILVDDADQVIGRVAAFINQKTVNRGNDQPTGGMGFFECVNDQQAAWKLLDQCRDWLSARGMGAMDGPINFGSRDRWWGLLVEGFDCDPNYQCNYNFPYYRTFFEAYGFQVYFYQLTFHRAIAGPLSPRLEEKAALIATNPDYEFRFLRKDEMSRLPDYILEVYNRAWANRSENPELSPAQARLLVKQMKPVLDRKLLYFGFYKHEPVSFFLALPEINQILRYVNGKLDLIGKIKFLWHTLNRTNRRAFGILFGVVPEHQGKGLDGAMVISSKHVLEKEYKRYHDFEMNWIGDFNPKMIVVVEQIGAQVIKRHATYRKLFDETRPFKRSPILN